MREILFRGFHEDKNGKETIYIDGREIKGEWVEGNLFVPDKSNTPTQICIGTNILRITYDVIPKTVGQFTGLTDKNGKKIFEGDIVKCRHEWARRYQDFTIDDLLTMPIPTEIEEQKEFEEQTIRNAYGKHIGVNEIRKCFYYYRNYVAEHYALNGRYRFRNGSVFHDMTKNYIFNRNAEVIGNIHDNPELLRSDCE